MDVRKITGNLARPILRWLKNNKLSLLIGSAVFFLIMFISIPGFQTSQADKTFGSVVLTAGLINYTYWTLANRQNVPVQENRRIKGRRKQP